jgi:hypothetical protein
MISTEGGRKIDLSEEQPQKALLSIRLSLQFILSIIFTRELQYKKHFEQMISTDAGMKID